MKSWRPGLAYLLLASMLGCSGDRTLSRTGAGQDAATWRLSPEPLLEIGVVSGEEVYQLHGVVGAVRLEDGRIVVANDGTREIRFFGLDGRFLRSWGREGNGPEEVRRLFSIRARAGDTLVVVDGTRRRFVHLTPGGEFVRADAWAQGEVFPADDWMLWRTVVRSPVPPGRRGVVAAALSALAPYEGPGFRFVRVGEDGGIWVAPSEGEGEAGDTVHWQVLDLTGRLTARLDTPPDFRIHDSGPGWVLGVWQDPLGVQYVRLYAVDGMEERRTGTLAEAVEAFTGREPDYTPVTGDVLVTSRALLRNVASLQELFYSRNMTYSASVDSLDTRGTRLELPEGLELAVLSADATGWMGQTRETRSGTTCLMNLMVAGWMRLTSPAGIVHCWREDPAPAAPAP